MMNDKDLYDEATLAKIAEMMEDENQGKIVQSNDHKKI